MGATQAEMNYQLFLDTFLTVGIAFLLSLLIAHDLIPVFNRIMSGRITTWIFSESGRCYRYLRTNPDHVHLPSLLHEPENRQPDG